MSIPKTREKEKKSLRTKAFPAKASLSEKLSKIDFPSQMPHLSVTQIRQKVTISLPIYCIYYSYTIVFK